MTRVAREGNDFDDPPAGVGEHEYSEEDAYWTLPSGDVQRSQPEHPQYVMPRERRPTDDNLKDFFPNYHPIEHQLVQRDSFGFSCESPQAYSRRREGSYSSAVPVSYYHVTDPSVVAAATAAAAAATTAVPPEILPHEISDQHAISERPSVSQIGPSSQGSSLYSSWPSYSPVGPLPAATPQGRDNMAGPSSRVQWLTIEPSKKGGTASRVPIKILCNMDGYQSAEYSMDFKKRNCVYPKALVEAIAYTGNRFQYETDCNKMAWRLASLNPQLDSQRNLLQKGVDAYRNSCGDPSMQSRRAQRLAKRKLQRGTRRRPP